MSGGYYSPSAPSTTPQTTTPSDGDADGFVQVPGADQQP
jgi:hypothetical protein